MKRLVARLIPARFRSSAVEIPVIRMSGTISASGSQFRPALNLAAVAPLLEKAFAIKEAPAVAISINSPGGSPVQSRLIYKRIRDLAAEKNKRVFMFVEDVAASGGYMIAVAGDEIIADPSSIVGSIGVISASFGFTGLMEKLGVERRVHTAGNNKSVLDPFSPEKEKDIEHLKALQLEIHDVFIAMVKERRGTKLVDHADLFTGLFWTGMKGKELGLVDELGDMRGFLKMRYGEKTKLRVISQSRGLLGMRGGAGGVSAIGASAAETLVESTNERAHWARFGL
jgi:signal peptide peptidase SppA